MSQNKNEISRTRAIFIYLRSLFEGSTMPAPTSGEIAELKKACSAEEWLAFYEQMPAEFQVATK